MGLEVAWPLGLTLAGVTTVALFITAKRRTSQPPNRRRVLFAFASGLGFSTSIAAAPTALYFTVLAGYCEDPGFCMPKWWLLVGLSLFVVVVGLWFLSVKGIQEYRRVG
jgi:hypothetical protein